MDQTAAAEGIQREDLSELVDGRLAFVLHGVLAKEECDAIARAADSVGFKPALVTTGFKTQENQPDHRRGENCYLFDDAVSRRVFDRIGGFLPQDWCFGRLLGLNSRLTVLRYHPGDFFGEHRDGTVIEEDDSAISFITVQLYLNDDFEGGETTLFPDGPARAGEARSRRRRVAVKPTTGSALVFEHKILHEGSAVRRGVKLSLRANAMYSRYYPSADAEEAGDPAAAAVADSGDAIASQPRAWCQLL